MSTPALRYLTMADVIGVPLLIAAFIWDLQFRWPNSWLVFPVWLGLSFWLHHDTPKTLGWRADNLWPATKEATVFFMIFATAVIIAGLLVNGPHLAALPLFSPQRLWLYFAFCLLQQVALQSFLNNRLIALCERPWLSSLLAGAIFSALHWPNPVLVPTTFVGGTALAWLFARNRNIFPLAIGQALIGSLLWLSFPVEWHHRMRVGPGYFRPF